MELSDETLKEFEQGQLPQETMVGVRETILANLHAAELSPSPESASPKKMSARGNAKIYLQVVRLLTEEMKDEPGHEAFNAYVQRAIDRQLARAQRDNCALGRGNKGE